LLKIQIEGHEFSLVMVPGLLLEKPGVVVVQVTVDGVGRILDVIDSVNPLATIDNHPQKDTWEIMGGGKTSFAVHYDDNDARRKMILEDVQRSITGQGS